MSVQNDDSTKNYFNPESLDPIALRDAWLQCAQYAKDHNDIDWTSFVQGYRYLCVILKAMGTFVDPITKDLVEKLNAVEAKRQEDIKQNGDITYSATLKKLIDYERDHCNFTNCGRKSPGPFACRQAQLIIRALQMLAIFLRRLATNGEKGGHPDSKKDIPINFYDDPTRDVGIGPWLRDGYNNSPLFEHHGITIKVIVNGVVTFMPYKSKFFKDMRATVAEGTTPPSDDDAREILDVTAQSMQIVFDTAKAVYKSYSLGKDKNMWGLK